MYIYIYRSYYHCNCHISNYIKTEQDLRKHTPTVPANYTTAVNTEKQVANLYSFED
jgi:hypothetical protein